MESSVSGLRMLALEQQMLQPANCLFHRACNKNVERLEGLSQGYQANRNRKPKDNKWRIIIQNTSFHTILGNPLRYYGWHLHYQLIVLSRKSPFKKFPFIG